MIDPYYGSSVSVEWYTPRYLVDGVISVLGAVDCDPCSNPPPYNVPAMVHYIRADDGLLHPWTGRIYCNPPYGRSLPSFIEKLATERQAGRCTEAITLTPARTDTAWFQYLWQADTLCFMRGRVRFIQEGRGLSESMSTFPTVLAYYGPAPDRFAAVFGALGQIVYPSRGPLALAPYQPLLWQVGA